MALFSTTAIVSLIATIGILEIDFPAYAQDSNFRYTVAEIEKIFRTCAFEIDEIASLQRAGGNGPSIYQAQRATLRLDGNKTMKAKWKIAPAGGEAFNNQPRYEVAAYQLQMLFLQPEEYVVPPTVLTSLPVRQYEAIDRKVVPTFDDIRAVIFMLQYWLENVRQEKVFEKDRFGSDSLYARHLGNMNILSYLIKHQDSNVGNFLASTDPENPRVFAVDNGVAFASDPSARGTEWRNLRVKRLPRTTISRLREITFETLQEQLGVISEFRIVRGLLFPVDPTANLNASLGLRKNEHSIQFGLTKKEIDDVYARLQKLLENVSSGEIVPF